MNTENVKRISPQIIL